MVNAIKCSKSLLRESLNLMLKDVYRTAVQLYLLESLSISLLISVKVSKGMPIAIRCLINNMTKVMFRKGTHCFNNTESLYLVQYEVFH